MNYNKKYDDIITLPHHVSEKHPQMSLYARSAQFAPFSALTGYEDVVKETARLTDKRIELDEEVKSILDGKLQIIQEHIKNQPQITFTYFVPDLKKNGGLYKTVTEYVKKIDDYNQLIILNDNSEIKINYIIDISGDIFKEYF